MKKEDTVKLISSDGFEFIVDKEAAMVSQTIRNMLTSPGFLSFDHFTFLLFFRLVRLGFQINANSYKIKAEISV